MKYKLKKKSWKYACEFSNENTYIDKGIIFTIYWCSWWTGRKKIQWMADKIAEKNLVEE